MSNSKSSLYIQSVSLNEDFSITPNSLWENKTLSWKSKGLMGYLLSRPKNWRVHTWQLAEIYKGEGSGNGLEGIQTMIKELRDHGYIQYRKYRNEKGQWEHEYTVLPFPIDEFKKMFPERQFPGLEKPGLEKPGILTSTEKTKTELPLVIVRKPHGKYVKLSDEEYQSLCKKEPKEKVDAIIEEINDHCTNNRPKGYDDYVAAFRTFLRNQNKTQGVKYGVTNSRGIDKGKVENPSGIFVDGKRVG